MRLLWGDYAHAATPQALAYLLGEEGGEAVISLDSRYLALRQASFLARFSDIPGVPVENMFAGDAAFCNADGTRSACVEVKEVRDILDCLEHTGRLMQQMRNAREAGHELYCVIVQGLCRTADGYCGVLRRGGPVPVTVYGSERPVPYRQLDNFLTTLDLIEGVLVKRSQDDAETAEIIKDLYAWWQKDIEDHQSTRRFYTPVYMPLVKHSLVRRVAKELPGVSIDRSRDIDRHFRSLREMVLADKSEWMQIKGIGKGLSESITRAIEGRSGANGQGESAGVPE